MSELTGLNESVCGASRVYIAHMLKLLLQACKSCNAGSAMQKMEFKIPCEPGYDAFVSFEVREKKAKPRKRIMPSFSFSKKSPYLTWDLWGLKRSM